MSVRPVWKVGAALGSLFAAAVAITANWRIYGGFPWHEVLSRLR